MKPKLGAGADPRRTNNAARKPRDAAWGRLD